MIKSDFAMSKIKIIDRSEHGKVVNANDLTFQTSPPYTQFQTSHSIRSYKIATLTPTVISSHMYTHAYAKNSLI